MINISQFGQRNKITSSSSITILRVDAKDCVEIICKNMSYTLNPCVPPTGKVEELSHRCKRCFSGTVVNLLPHRIPGGKLSSLLPVLTNRAVGDDFRLLHVVRDPRASINSR